MKLKLFEEFKGNPDLLQNVKDCFQDLIDDEIVEVMDNDNMVDEYKSTVCLYCNIPSDKIDTSSFDVFFESKEKIFNTLLEIKKCANRLHHIHTKEIDINFEMENENDVSIYISEGIPEVGDFWKIKTNGLVKLDFDKLKSFFELPILNCSMSTNGTNYFLYIYFKDKEDLDSYGSELINKMLSFKINEVDIVSSEDKKEKYKIFRDYNTHRSTGYYDNKKEIVNYIEFTLNSNLKWDW